MNTKYIVVLGSLMSGIGKGIVTSSIGKILSFYDYNVMTLKFDGYLNYDCGTMNPFRHGEVFVLEDGGEVDMDFGNYERFLNKNSSSKFSITGGKIFSDIIKQEREGKFLGSDVQFIPHITDYIINKVKNIAKEEKLDIMLIEVGGTVGDIENSYFLEAMRQLSLQEQVLFINITYVAELKKVGEQKTKPTQLAIRNLLEIGIRPNYIICRSENKINDSIKSKIAFFSNISEDRVIDDHDNDNIYDIPNFFMNQNLDKMILKDLNLTNTLNKEKYDRWNSIIEKGKNASKTVKIAVVGKYMKLHDSYASIKEALVHAAYKEQVNLDIKWIESEEFEKNKEALKMLDDCNAVLVPGGFGNRGIEGMINAIEYARTNKKPFLGICLGMQLMAVEYARNVCKLENANSSEFDENAKHKIIDLMDEQKKLTMKGATMRLGAWQAKLKKGTLAYNIYNKEIVSERHRHRYEFNNTYKEILEKKGLIISGTTVDGALVEFIEWRDSFGIGTQAHPELKSKLEDPAPLFVAFVKAAVENSKKN
ncbi:MAG: CTP synthase [Candidatus Micrarchaeia archaeon]